jgi:hypothetical protein
LIVDGPKIRLVARPSFYRPGMIGILDFGTPRASVKTLTTVVRDGIGYEMEVSNAQPSLFGIYITAPHIELG